jgi:hypothetical protein
MGDQHRQRLGHRAGQVLVGVDRHQAVDVEAALDVDVGDPGVGVRGAHERGGQRGVPDVVEVAALADDQPGVLAPAHRLPEELGRHRGTPDVTVMAMNALTGRSAGWRRRGARPS